MNEKSMPRAPENVNKDTVGSVYELIAANTQNAPLRKRACSDEADKPPCKQPSTRSTPNSATPATFFTSRTFAAAGSDAAAQRRQRAHSESDV